MNSIMEWKLLHNRESLSRISVCRRFPASFGQDLEDQCSAREPGLFISFYYYPKYFFPVFNSSIVNFVESVNSGNEIRLISTLYPSGIFWTLMNRNKRYRNLFIRSATQELHLCFIFLCLWSFRNGRFLTSFFRRWNRCMCIKIMISIDFHLLLFAEFKFARIILAGHQQSLLQDSFKKEKSKSWNQSGLDWKRL